MKTSIKITLELDLDEAKALSKLIGDHSKQDHEKHGLTSAQSALVSEIYNELVFCFPDDEQT